MIPQSVLSHFANHVWQSTVFAGVCGIATVFLRKNGASVRHRIWMLASLKFLVPFSLLVGFGGYLSARTHVDVAPKHWAAVRSIGAPFPASATAMPAAARVAPSPGTQQFFGVSFLIASIWFFGAVVVCICGVVRWRRLAARRGNETPIPSGRELEALRRVQERYGWSLSVRLTSTSSAVEPGVRGLFRPVLSLPAGICDRLDDEELEAILVHELCHIRRHDNFAAVLHLIVETIVWFHPLVWWMGSRLVEERERACDEAVLQLGNDAHAYAEAILRVCEFYVLTPAAGVSRVTGSNLSKRIEEIMTERRIHRIGIGRKLALIGAGFVLLAAPIAFGMTHSAEVAATPVTAAMPEPAQSTPAPAVSRAVGFSEPAPVPAVVPLVRTVSNAEPDYILGPQDEVEISIWHQPDLTRQVVVRSDGKIGIPLISDIQAAGLTPMELREAIRSELATYLRDPIVSVIVVAAKSSQVTIQGFIAKPGVYSLGRPTTVLELIAEAGGLAEFAHSEKISIIRKEGGKTIPYYFNYNTFRTGDYEQNVTLKAGDIVIVP
jgi:protein involved in polysaccharide export with SLBB domain/beta-lactamase regulating signal transducer with metallopeptidase domain